MITGQNYLVTCSSWFQAPDGKDYTAVFGAYDHQSSDLDFLVFGNVTISKKNITTVIKCEYCSFEDAQNWFTETNLGIKFYQHPTKIYNANQKPKNNVVELKI